MCLWEWGGSGASCFTILLTSLLLNIHFSLHVFCATWSITKRERKLLKYFGPHLPFTNKYFVFCDSTLYVTLITLTESLKANQCNSSTEVYFSWKEKILPSLVVTKCRIADHWSRHSVGNTAVWHPSEKPTTNSSSGGNYMRLGRDQVRLMPWALWHTSGSSAFYIGDEGKAPQCLHCQSSFHWFPEPHIEVSVL